MTQSPLPPPVTVHNPQGGSDWLILCEHASCFIPPAYGLLGLPPGGNRAHIGWDIGAAAVALDMARRMDAVCVTAGYSRLLIDLNRPIGAAGSIPERSEATGIPGNRALSAQERARREAAYFHPFHDRVAALLDARAAGGRRTRIVAIHSFTPIFLGVARPWHLGVLALKSRPLAKALLAAVARRDPDLCLALDEPYRIALDEDYAIPVHGDARGLDALLVEMRNDLIAEPDGARDWAERLAKTLAGI
ncbi:MAG: N-formylglutamate amidohydrolase [Paracoccus sp. (in: a-proteobacteria)]|uniref:N-formylglutamate amidohydrolase n=1 Tax=Paracoccus sp. TaxID=267 RepID=UPI0039E3310E